MAQRSADFVARVARRIAETRADRGMTQEALAARLDIATKNVQRLESGKQNLTLRSIERVATALRTKPEAFFTRVAKTTRAPGVLERLEHLGFDVREATAKGRKAAGSAPVMSLEAAAGSLRGSSRNIDAVGWVVIPGTRDASLFVAEVRGESMRPLIPDRSLCLFRATRSGIASGKTFLVEHRAIDDAELGGPFAVKRIGNVTRLRNGRVRVELRSVNRDYAPLLIELDDEAELRVIAEFVKVLDNTAS